MKKLVTYYILFLLSFPLANLWAAGSAGTSGADFLELGVGSRALGMAEAFTSIPNDIHSIYYNPAGLGTLKYPMLSVHHQELILDSRMEYVAGAFQLPVGVLGFSSTFFWVPSFDKVDINGVTTGTVDYLSGNLLASYAYNFGDVSLGGSVKWIYKKVDTLFLNAVAFDLGILVSLYLYSPFEAPLRNFHIGISVSNLGTYLLNDPLPGIIRIGFSYDLTNWIKFSVDISETFITAEDLLDFTYGFDENFRLSIGVELNYRELLYLRGGYAFNNGTTYSIGLGVHFVVGNVSFAIDTSYMDAAVFGSVFTFNVSFKLIPKVITLEDKSTAEIFYREGIRHYMANDIDSALESFKKSKKYDPYHKNIKKKIRDLEELIELKKKNKKLDEELKKEENERKEKEGRNSTS